MYYWKGMLNDVVIRYGMHQRRFVGKDEDAEEHQLSSVYQPLKWHAQQKRKIKLKVCLFRHSRNIGKPEPYRHKTQK